MYTSMLNKSNAAMLAHCVRWRTLSRRLYFGLGVISIEDVVTWKYTGPTSIVNAPSDQTGSIDDRYEIDDGMAHVIWIPSVNGQATSR
jgi:hypothetical protein